MIHPIERIVTAELSKIDPDYEFDKEKYEQLKELSLVLARELHRVDYFKKQMAKKMST